MTAYSFWRRHWAGQTDGGHRSSTPEFLDAEADEKLFHLRGGESLLDVGCGTAELLVRFAPSYRRAVGIDFSEGMLAVARQRLDTAGLDRVELFSADTDTMWQFLTPPFDRVTGTALVQYLDRGQLTRFLQCAASCLSPTGTIALFDIIDPRLFLLYDSGLLTKSSRRRRLALELPLGALRTTIHRGIRLARRLPPSQLGYAYHPDEVTDIAGCAAMTTQIVSSMYYEYRYHALLSPRQSDFPSDQPGSAPPGQER